MLWRREYWRLWVAIVGLRGVSVCRRKRQASMQRKRKNTRHLSQFLKVIKSSVDLVVSAIIVRMRCSHLFKPACALTQHAQLDCSNECRCGVPLTSSQLLECTIRTFPHPTRTQIMSATFLSPLTLTCLCLICCKSYSRYCFMFCSTSLQFTLPVYRT